MFNKLTGSLKNLSTFVFELFEKMVNGIQTAFGKISTGMKSIGEKIQNIINKMKDNILKVLEKMQDNIKIAFEKIKKGMKDFGKKVEDFFKNLSKYLKKAFETVKKAFQTLFKKVAKFFENLWNGIKNAFTKVFDILSDPLSFFMNIFGEITIKMTKGVNKTFQSSLWSFFPPEWKGTLNKYGTYILLGVSVLCLALFFGINALINFIKTDGLCVDPKDNSIVYNQFNEGIKENSLDCPYNIPEGICENPNTKRIYTNDAGQQLTSDHPDCPGYIQPKVVEEVIPIETLVETPVETQEEKSYTDFRKKLQTQIGGRRRRRRRRY